MLKLTDITKKFDDKVIFDGFSYTFEDKGIYLIKGDSGIGKTTLLRMIAGLDNDYGGTIEGGGPKNVSFSFQEYRLFGSLSALDNVLVAINNPTEKDRDRVVSILERLGLSGEEIKLYPSELSGGMKLRVSIARAALKNAPVLLLDEPTRELDDRSAHAVLMLASEIAKERTVIIVTHDDYESLLTEVTSIHL